MFTPDDNAKQDELKSLESALRSLAPAASATTASESRDRIMFLAGQASVSPASLESTRTRLLRRTAWPLATAASMLIAALLGRATAPDQVQIVERVIQVPLTSYVESNADRKELIDALQPAPDPISSSKPDVRNEGTSTTRWTLASAFPEVSAGQMVDRPYTRLRDQVLALGPDVLPAVGRDTVKPAKAGANSILELRYQLEPGVPNAEGI